MCEEEGALGAMKALVFAVVGVPQKAWQSGDGGNEQGQGQAK
jgi:hypothetical protein